MTGNTNKKIGKWALFKELLKLAGWTNHNVYIDIGPAGGATLYTWSNAYNTWPEALFAKDELVFFWDHYEHKGKLAYEYLQKAKKHYGDDSMRRTSNAAVAV